MLVRLAVCLLGAWLRPLSFRCCLAPGRGSGERHLAKRPQVRSRGRPWCHFWGVPHILAQTHMAILQVTLGLGIRSHGCCRGQMENLPSNAIWLWLKIKQQGQTAGLGPCFHLPGQPILEFRFLEPQPFFGGVPHARPQCNQCNHRKSWSIFLTDVSKRGTLLLDDLKKGNRKDTNHLDGVLSFETPPTWMVFFLFSHFFHIRVCQTYSPWLDPAALCRLLSELQEKAPNFDNPVYVYGGVPLQKWFDSPLNPGTPRY